MSESPSADSSGKPSASVRHGRHKSLVTRTLLRVYVCKEAQEIVRAEYRGKGKGDSVGQALERKLGVLNPKEDKSGEKRAPAKGTADPDSKRRASKS